MIYWQDLWKLSSIQEKALCQTCQEQMETKIEGVKCQYCQHPIGEGHTCLDCQIWLNRYGVEYLKQEAIFTYNEYFKSWIKTYKYLGDIRQARAMIVYLQDYYQKYKDYTWTYLPSSPKNLKRRGFNPSQEILEKSGIPYVSLFEYVGDGESQARKSRSERLNMSTVFVLKENSLKVKKILIFDDVYTTGTTLMRAKEVLFVAGAEEVKSLTLARDMMKNENI